MAMPWQLPWPNSEPCKHNYAVEAPNEHLKNNYVVEAPNEHLKTNYGKAGANTEPANIFIVSVSSFGQFPSQAAVVAAVERRAKGRNVL